MTATEGRICSGQAHRISSEGAPVGQRAPDARSETFCARTWLPEPRDAHCAAAKACILLVSYGIQVPTVKERFVSHTNHKPQTTQRGFGPTFQPNSARARSLSLALFPRFGGSALQRCHAFLVHTYVYLDTASRSARAVKRARWMVAAAGGAATPSVSVSLRNISFIPCTEMMRVPGATQWTPAHHLTPSAVD